jgi:hypothetical protein
VPVLRPIEDHRTAADARRRVPRPPPHPSVSMHLKGLCRDGRRGPLVEGAPASAMVVVGVIKEAFLPPPDWRYSHKW